MRYGWAASMEAKQCLHQIQEPAPMQDAQPVAGQCRFKGHEWGACHQEHVAMVLKNPEEWPDYEVRYLYAAPAAVAVPENVREGAPYDNPAFEKLARELGVWGTAQSAICAQFWLAATPADHIADAGKKVAAPAGWKLVPVQVPDSAFPWVSGGYSIDYRAHDPRDQKIIEDRAQRTWEAILDGIAATPPADAKQAEFEAIRMFWAQHGSQKVLGMSTIADLHADVERTIRQHATAAAPVVLPEQDAVLLNQGVELLHALSNDERNRGNCSSAEGATASAHAVQRLAAMLATGGQAQAVEKSATHGMNLGQRILHVGGRENAQTYIEFGSVAAVRALVDQVLRDLPDGAPGFVLPAPQAQADARDALPMVAYLCIEDSGVIDFEVIPPCTLPPGEYSLYAKNRAAIAAAKGE